MAEGGEGWAAGGSGSVRVVDGLSATEGEDRGARILFDYLTHSGNSYQQLALPMVVPGYTNVGIWYQQTFVFVVAISSCNKPREAR